MRRCPTRPMPEFHFLLYEAAKSITTLSERNTSPLPSLITSSLLGNKTPFWFLNFPYSSLVKMFHFQKNVLPESFAKGVWNWALHDTNRRFGAPLLHSRAPISQNYHFYPAFKTVFGSRAPQHESLGSRAPKTLFPFLFGTITEEKDLNN